MKRRVGSGNTCLVLQEQLCQMQAGTLTARSYTILRATMVVFDLALLHKNNSQQLRVFPEHWGMSPPVPRLVRDSCPHKTPAATKPVTVCNCSSAASTAEPKGFLQWSSPLPVHHPTAPALWMPFMPLSGIECLVLNNLFQRVLLYR